MGQQVAGTKPVLWSNHAIFIPKKKKKVETVKEEKHGECIKTASGQNVFLGEFICFLK